MKRYEVIAIVKTDLTEEDMAAIIDRSSNIITERKGVIAKVEKWGKRRLAYEINKQRDGFISSSITPETAQSLRRWSAISKSTIAS